MYPEETKGQGVDWGEVWHRMPEWQGAMFLIYAAFALFNAVCEIINFIGWLGPSPW